jgi:prepilin-type N-terminal cleavage/methylation domain-containing protein
MSGRRGFTLIELMIALVIAGVVMTAAYRILAGNQRFYRAQSQIVEVQQNIRTVAQVLPGDLRELASAAGDIYAMSDTSIEIRAMRGFGVVCTTPVPATGLFIVRNSQLFTYRSIDPSRSRLFVYSDGPLTSSASDDSWLEGSITTVTTVGALCADGTAGTSLVVNITGGNTQLSGVTIGAPVRIYERVRYNFYNDGTGTWWMGTQSYASGSWSSVSPVAGPLRASDGLKFDYYDNTGAVTATPASVAAILITVRGMSTQSINIPGRVQGRYQDSLQVRVTLRNN